MSEFSDRPFVAGSLVGMRAFSVDALGRLRGPSFDQIFKPGENEAECRRGKESNSWGGMFASLAVPNPRFSMGLNGQMTYYIDEPKPPTEEDRAKAKEKAAAAEAERLKNHTLAGVDCTCGFYAYFDGRNDYKQHDRATALIEGYGVCTVGTAGFRASKARLVAIVQPGSRFNTVRAELIQRNYPDVPLYDRKRDALDAHPLSTDHIPTPDAEDFWTMEAGR